MSSDDVRVSVVIPAFNAGGTITGQLEALAAQVGGSAVGDVEVLVADNGCTDDTVAVVAGFRDRLRVRIVDAGARSGPAAARNIGAEAARGELLVFTDADDVVVPGWVDAWCRLDPHSRFATGPVQAFDAGEPAPRALTATAMHPPTHLGFLPYALGTNFAVRRDVFAAAGGFPEDRSTAEDVVLSWELQLGGVALDFVREAGVAKRRAGSGRATLRQHYRYGMSDPFVVARFRSRGLRHPSFVATARSYAGLIVRLPLLADPVQRRKWIVQAGRRAGRLVGSVRARTVCL